MLLKLLKAQVLQAVHQPVSIFENHPTKNKYIDDIGIVNGNRILCTAGWGTLRSSILLSSPPYQTPSGYLLYPVRKDNVHLRNPGTVTIKHNIAVVSPALTFANVLNVNPDFTLPGRA
ncbi:CSS-motif domain-containing protein [Klebsiella pneumoniae]|nr:CSS-motif domain-containing protein [Klebsiella pneumoniae]